MELAEYRNLICAGLGTAIYVPYVPVSLGDWQPLIADCHNNVDRWVRSNDGDAAVRGWVIVATDGGTGLFLTHHSVVRGKDGRLFDITPLESEISIRKTMRFIPHVGSDNEFFYFKDRFQPFLICHRNQNC